MKKIIYFLVFVLLFSSCESNVVVSKKVDKVLETKAINTVLDGWHTSATEANFETYFESMSNEAVFIGTDASENWKLSAFKNFSKPYFDKGIAWDFKPVSRNVYVHKNGNFAWFDELLDTWMGVCRGSGVLIKNEDTWKIEHYVLSLTVPNNNIQEVIKINKVKDSLFLQKLNK